mmetsp:Transcript_63783/g.120778  ORF Transcript_63783/g.120778 Transcript_63783/m.120778 type:complete len:259 (-) Transcript_63783:418-1194(-)
MCTMDLDGIVNDLQSSPRCSDLDHCNVSLCSFEALLISNDCCQVAKLPTFGNLDAGLGDLCAHVVLLGENAAKSFAPVGAVHNCCKCQLRLANGTHAVMDSAWTKTSLCNLKASALTKNHVPLWHAHVVEDDLSMIVFCTKDCQRPENLYAWSILGHQNHGLLFVERSREARSAEEDKDLALWANSTRDPPLVTVDHILITIRFDSSADVCGITGSNTWLRHGEGRANLAIQKRLQPLLLLLWAAELLDDLHVSCVGG